jgi:hypothetical protein
MLVSLFASSFVALAGFKTHALDQMGACSMAHVSAYMRNKAAAMTPAKFTSAFPETRVLGEVPALPRARHSFSGVISFSFSVIV